MNLHRTLILLAAAAVVSAPSLAAGAEVVRYCRFQAAGGVAYGVVEGDKVTQIEGDPFGPWKKTAKTYNLGDVKLLVPCQPTQVLARAGNYRSHLKDTASDPKFKLVQPFFQTPSCLVPTGASIVIPKGTAEVHYEAEMVVVIGKRCKDVPEEKALDYVLGVTCGNDVSARDW